MAARRQIEDGVGRSARGGIPLSRAKRLSDAANDSPRRTWMLGVALPVVALIAAGGLFLAQFGTDASPTDVTAVDTTASTATPATPAPAPATPASPDPVRTASVAPAPVPVSAPTPERSALPSSCKSAIDFTLQDMDARATAEVLTWSDQRDVVRKLVQSVLDCPMTALEVQGSLELMDRDLADLTVTWNVSAGRLALTTLGQGGAAVADAAPVPPGLLRFSLH